MSKGIGKAIRLLEHFKNLDSEMSISAALALLYAEQAETQRDVETRLGMSNAAASRNVSYWTEWKRYQVAGMNMVETREKPEDRRYRLISYTPKGEAFVEQIRNIFGD